MAAHMLPQGQRELEAGASTVVVAVPDDVANEGAVAGRKPAAQNRVEVGCTVAAAPVHVSVVAGPTSSICGE